MVNLFPDVHGVCEFLAHWLGGTTRAELGALLGYGDRQITSLLKLGDEVKGSKHRHDPSLKRWVSTGPAKDLHGPRSADQVIAVLRAINAWEHDATQHRLAPVVDIASFNRPVSPDLFALLLGACVRKQAVSVRYRAKTRDLAVVFSPHIVVQATHRTHFRGYSFFEESGRGHYWDLVPTRLLDASIIPNAPYINNSDDEDWHNTARIELMLNPNLPPELRESLIIEYGMDKKNMLVINDVPMALRSYIISSYIDRKYSNFEHSAWSLIG
jgi:hypothetical protein